MKLILILNLTLLLHVSASVYSQKTLLDYDVKNQTVKDILKDIESKTGFRFFYNDDYAFLNHKVNLNVNNSRVEYILDELLADTDVSYKVLEDNLIVLLPKVEVQQITVSGTITDLEGTALPGVNIVEKGTTNGAVTNLDGKYSISIGSAEAILSFSYVGYITEEVSVNGQTTLDVTMVEDIQALDEVVVIGYGKMKKSDLTGSVTSVSSDDIAAFPSIGVSEALQGRASGVEITQLNGEPGAGTRIRIRGGTSINASSDPLWVVDGFAGGIAPPPEDIASIEILKDASATAIYGSRGANGVILVTTKSGKVGKTKIELNTSYSFDNIEKTLDLLNASEFAAYINEARINDGADQADIPFPNPSTYGEGTDWQDVIFRQGNKQNYQLSASGGKENYRFYTSVNYYDQDGIIINSNYKRISTQSKLDFKAGDNINLGTKMFYRRSTQDGVRTQAIYGGYEGAVTNALSFDPTVGIYDDNGNYSAPSFLEPSDNPYVTASEFVDEDVNDLFQGSGYLDWSIFNGLTFNSTFGVFIRNNRNGSYWPTTTIQGGNVDGRAAINTTKASNFLNENYFSYNKEFGGNHKLNLVAGFSYQSNRNEWWTSSTETFISDAFLYWNLDGGSNYRLNYSELTEWNLLSYYARANYNLSDKYLITFTGRYDGSSRFGENNKWGFFPSGALAWNLAREPFMESINQLSQLKIRASYGVTGNTDIGSYQSLAQFEAVSAIINDVPVNAVRPSSVANSDLSWESTNQTDIGLDLGLWNSRVLLNIDYYYMKTVDLLYSVPLPEFSGYTSSLKNIGSVENKGLEFSLSTANIQSNSLTWTTDFNLSFNKNKILSLPDGEMMYTMAIGSFNMDATHILTEGSPVGSFYGYIYEGVNRDDGAVVYKDIAGFDEEGNQIMEPDGEISSADRTIIGDPHPDYTFGFTNTFTYKNFDLNIFFQGVVGNDMYNFTRMMLEVANGRNNQSTTVLDRWTTTNQDASIPKATSNNNYISSSRWVEDGTYFRLRNISLGYNIPNTIIEKTGIEKLRIYASAQNLFTITDYTGYTPDVGYRSDNTSLGLDFGSYPSAKSITLGLNLSF